MAAKSEGNRESSEGGKNLGVLYTGYLDKKNPVTGSFKKRFVVLTQHALHWFVREEGCDLFGEERGQISLGNILTTRILDEDSAQFELQTTDHKKKYFRCATNVVCEEWVSAVRSASKALSKQRGANALQRRQTISGIRGNILDDADEGNTDSANTQDVTVALVSLSSARQQSEVVVTRNPDWNRIITLPVVKNGDQIIISVSNGGFVRLSYELILSKAEDGLEFDVAVQSVPLASSLKISLLVEGAEKSDFVETRSRSRKASGREQVIEVGAIIITNRSCAINTVLSMMVIMAGISSLHAFGIDAFLFVLLSTGLSMYNLLQVIETAKELSQSKDKGIAVRLVIHGHTFTSPDAPVTDPENDAIPQRFIDGCDGDLKEARRRWDITRHWRESEGVNGILDEPQPYFHLIRAMWPHYHCGRGKSGHIVYYERPGEFEGQQLAARGVTADDLIRHWLFTTEYQWRILCNDDESAKSIAVMDLAGVKLTDLAGDNLTFMKKALGIANQHYPERSFVIYIVNAPIYFSMGWRLVKPMVHENTQKKIRILSAKETLKGLMEHIDFDQIPEWYGGGLDFGGKDSCRFHCPETAQITEYVKKINDRQSLSAQTKIPFSDVTASSTGVGSGNNAPSSPTQASTTSSLNNISVNTSLPAAPHSMPPGECGDQTNLSHSHGHDQSKGSPMAAAPPLPPSASVRGIMKRGSSAGPGKVVSIKPPVPARDDWSMTTAETNNASSSTAEGRRN